MNVNYQEIVALIESRKDVFGRFEYAGLEHVVVQQRFDYDKTPAWYSFPNSLVNGVQINFGQNTDLRFAKPILMHELAEWAEIENHRDSGDMHNYTYKKGSRLLAHRKATKFDERYANDLFDEALFKEYLAYKQKLS
jgi:hypothetical protein